MGPLKSIRYSGDFVLAGFVIAGFVSIYFTEILPGFQMLFVITGSSLKRGSLKRGSTVFNITFSIPFALVKEIGNFAFRVTYLTRTIVSNALVFIIHLLSSAM